MFFRKKPKEKQLTPQEAQQEILKQLRKEFNEAAQCPDPAERFLKFEDIKQSIDGIMTAKTKDVAESAKKWWHLGYLGVAGPSSAAIGALVFGLHFPPAIFLIYPAISGGIAVGQKAVKNKIEKGLNDLEPFFDALGEQRDEAEAAADHILKTELTALARSDKLPTILERAPRVRDHFTEAFTKKVAEEDGKPRTPPKADGNNKFKL